MPTTVISPIAYRCPIPVFTIVFVAISSGKDAGPMHFALPEYTNVSLRWLKVLLA